MKLLERHYKTITQGIQPEMLADLIPIDITPSARWFLAESPQEHWEYDSDFPSITPPSPLTWIEYEAPDRIASSERVVENHQLLAAGIMAITFEIEPQMRAEALRQDLLLRYLQALDQKQRKFIQWEGDRSARHAYTSQALDKGLGARWITIWNLIAETNTHHVLGIGLYGMYLDEGGRIIRGLNACISNIPQTARPQDAEYDEFVEVLPFMFGLSLMHCKNVTMNEMPLPAALAKKRQKRDIPILTFRTLDIKPMRAQAKRESAAGESDTKRALHIVRGHFKEYSAEKPLFGRLVGRYWWNISARGSTEAGLSVHDYRVQPR